MGDTISQSQGTLQTQSSGFGMNSSILNKTIKSDMKSEYSARRTAREFFSKDNESHPSIEENKLLKDQLNHLKEVKKQTMSLSAETAEDVQQQALEVRLQLDSYKQFVNPNYTPPKEVPKGDEDPFEVRANPGPVSSKIRPPSRLYHTALEELSGLDYDYVHYGGDEYAHTMFCYFWLSHHLEPTKQFPSGRMFKWEDIGFDSDLRKKVRAYLNENIASNYSMLDLVYILALYHDAGKNIQKDSGNEIHHSKGAQMMWDSFISGDLDIPEPLDDIVSVMEITMSNLRADQGEVDLTDFIGRAEVLGVTDHIVMISDYFEYYRLAAYLRRYTDRRCAIVMGAGALRQIFDERYYARLEGGILEALGRLFKNDLHIFVYPQKDPETGTLWTVETLEVPKDVRHLYGYLVERGFLIPVEDYDESVLDIQAPEVLEKLQSGDAAWEGMVDERVAEVIKARKLFGFGAR